MAAKKPSETQQMEREGVGAEAEVKDGQTGRRLSGVAAVQRCPVQCYPVLCSAVQCSGV